MKKTFLLLFLFASLFTINAQTTFHHFSSITMSGDTLNMSQYYGKKVMVVNCASFCAYTPQYTPLEQLYEQYQQYGFEIIGFPSNDFANQGGTDSQIITTCHSYNVSFPIMETVHVASGSIDSIFLWLEKRTLNGVSNATVTWNFNKFLIDEAGHWVRHFTQATDPMDTAITNWIMSPSVVQTGISTPAADNMIEFKSANPTNSSIDFVLRNSLHDNMSVSLYASDGKFIQTLYKGTSDEQNISYPVSSLSTGIYFVRLESNAVQKTFRYAVVK